MLVEGREENPHEIFSSILESCMQDRCLLIKDGVTMRTK